MSKPVLFGFDGRRIPAGRFLQERTWNFWKTGDEVASGLEVFADTTGTVTVPVADSKPQRAVLTTTNVLNNAVRLASFSFTGNRYSVIELSVSRLALDTVNPSTVQVGISNSPSYNAGVYLVRTYGTSVGTQQPWVLSERTASPVNTETRLNTYAADMVNLTLVWFQNRDWAFVMDGDSVLHSQATPAAGGGTLRAYIRVIAASAAVATLEVSQMRLRLWHDL